MKRCFCLVLSIVFLIVALPSTFALDTKYRAKVLRGYNDGFSRYIEFEYNGKVYRSDQMGKGFNKNIWGLLDDEDKDKVVKTFGAWLTDRSAQFGEAHNDIANWVNDKQGWTQAGEVLKQRILNKNYPDLTDYFSDPNSIPVAGLTVASINISFLATYPEIVSSPIYTKVTEKISLLKEAYAAGQSCLACLANAKTLQVGTAVKSLSSDLISLIVSNALTPNIIISPSHKFASVFSDIVGILDEQIGISKALYQKLLGEKITSVTAGEVIHEIWEILNKTEVMGQILKTKCNQLISEIETDIINLQSGEAPIISHIEEQNEETSNEINDIISVGVVAEVYEFTSDAEDEEQRLAEIAAQWEAQRQEFISSYQEWASSIPGQIEQVLVSNNVKDSGAENWKPISIPLNILSKSNSLLFKISEPYLAENIIKSYNYEEIKEKISVAKEASMEYIDLKKAQLSQFEEDVSELLGFITEDYKSNIEPVIKGLMVFYEAEMYDYFIEGKKVLQSVGELHFWGGDNRNITVEREIERLEQIGSNIEANYNSFESSASSLEARLSVSKYTQYSTIKANLENAAYAFVENYNAINDARNNFVYFDGYIGSNLESVLIRILSKVSANDITKEQAISQVQSFIENELTFIRKMKAAKTHAEFYHKEMDDFLKQKAGGITNFSYITGYNIESADEIEDRLGYKDVLSFNNQINYNRTKNFTHYLPDVLADLLGYNAYYVQTLKLISDFEDEKYDILKLNEEDFANRIEQYNDEAGNIGYYSYNASVEYRTSSEANGAVVPLIGQFRFNFDHGLMKVKSMHVNYVPVDSIDFDAPQNQSYYHTMATGDLSDYFIGIGESLQLNAQISPASATEHQVIWSSDNIGVARVDGDGLITGIGNGKATIKIESLDGGFTAEKTITVGTGDQVDFYLDDITFVEDNQVIEIGGLINSNKLEDTDAYVLIALYKGNKLIDLNGTHATIYNNIPHGIYLSKQIQDMDVADLRAKIFLWTSDNMILPLMSSDYIYKQ